jgi:predicted nucleic acid-binding protein
MIVLDTNVISELMRPSPEPLVLRWLETQPLESLATTSINLAEIRYGLARLPDGRRRRDLETRFDIFVARSFGAARGVDDRIFDFDRTAAEVYGDLAALRESSGRRLEGFDGLIAAIAAARGAAIATRNAEDFAECGITVISPWTLDAP